MESILRETNGSPLKMLPGGPHVQGRTVSLREGEDPL